MTDHKVGAVELENIGIRCAEDGRPKQEICAEDFSTDPLALRRECLEYAECASNDGMVDAVAALVGRKPTSEELIAGGVAVGYELGFRAAQFVAELEK